MSEDKLEAIERRLVALEDERAIARLVACYGPLVDAGDAEGAAALWTQDGSYDTGDWTMSGRDEIADMVRSEAHQGLIANGCCHFFGPPVIEVNADDAVAVCDSTLLVRRDSGGYAVARAGAHVIRLRRDAGVWRITARTARQLDGGEAGRDLIAEAAERIRRMG